jgi:hypothetical protein
MASFQSSPTVFGRIGDVAISLHRIELSAGIEAGGFDERLIKRSVGRKRVSKEHRVEGAGYGQEEGLGKRALKDGPEEYDAAGHNALATVWRRSVACI